MDGVVRHHRAGEDRTGLVGVAEIGRAQHRMAQIGAAQIGPAEIGDVVTYLRARIVGKRAVTPEECAFYYGDQASSFCDEQK